MFRLEARIRTLVRAPAGGRVGCRIVVVGRAMICRVGTLCRIGCALLPPGMSSCLRALFWEEEEEARSMAGLKERPCCCFGVCLYCMLRLSGAPPRPPQFPLHCCICSAE